MVVVHGGGVLSSPDRIERIYQSGGMVGGLDGGSSDEGAKLTLREASDLLNGTLPDGTTIPVYEFDAFKKRGPDDQPRRYGVVLDLEVAKGSVNGAPRSPDQDLLIVLETLRVGPH